MADHAAFVALTTVSTPEQAGRLARRLVEGGFAGCVSILPGVRSIYRWQGEVADDQECLLLIKVASAAVGKLRRELLAAHPYEVPEFLVLEASQVPEPYRRWLEEATG